MENKTEEVKKTTKLDVIKEYLIYYGIILLVIIIGLFLNCCLKINLNPNITTILSALFYSGGTLGYLVTWEIQTFCGKTPPEKLNKYLLVFSYIFGTFFLILGIDLNN